MNKILKVIVICDFFGNCFLIGIFIEILLNEIGIYLFDFYFGKKKKLVEEYLL